MWGGDRTKILTEREYGTHGWCFVFTSSMVLKGVVQVGPIKEWPCGELVQPQIKAKDVLTSHYSAQVDHDESSVIVLSLTPFLAHLFFKMETWTYFEDLEAEVFEARALVAVKPSNWLTSLCAWVFLLST